RPASLAGWPVVIPEVERGGPGRRAVLRAGLLAAVGTPVASSLLAGCGPGYATAPDPLLPLLNTAHADAAAAAALPSSDASAIARVDARARGTHAEVLRAEIERLNRPRPENRDPHPPRINEVADLAPRLAEAREAAASLVPRLPAYRAGLVGSVAA